MPLAAGPAPFGRTALILRVMRQALAAATRVCLLVSYRPLALSGFLRLGGELSPASVYVSLLPVVEACVVVAVPGRVGEVRVDCRRPPSILIRTYSRAGLSQGFSRENGFSHLLYHF